MTSSIPITVHNSKYNIKLNSFIDNSLSYQNLLDINNFGKKYALFVKAVNNKNDTLKSIPNINKEEKQTEAESKKNWKSHWDK